MIRIYCRSIKFCYLYLQKDTVTILAVIRLNVTVEKSAALACFLSC
jgi:hypothetical protein